MTPSHTPSNLPDSSARREPQTRIDPSPVPSIPPGESGALPERPPTVGLEVWRDMIDAARRCPSPHNVQPWKIKLIDPATAELYIDGTRTFPWTDSTGSFIISTMSMFTTCLKYCAQERGLALDATLANLDAIRMPSPLSYFATLRLRPDPELGVPEYSQADIQRRMTSRLGNKPISIPAEVLAEVEAIVAAHGFGFHTTEDQTVIRRVLAQDIKALFHDINYRPYFSELQPWLKLGKADEQRDGLHYQAMNLPKWQFALLKHLPAAFNLPIVSALSTQLYQKQLGHTQRMVFLTGPFWDREASLNSGEMMIKMWLELSKHGVHIHPFGNLITNGDARKTIEQMLGVHDLWFVFRAGYTDDAPRSNRLPLDEVVLPRG